MHSCTEVGVINACLLFCYRLTSLLSNRLTVIICTGMRRRAARLKQYDNYRIPAGRVWPVRTSLAMSDAENIMIKGGMRIDIDVEGVKDVKNVAGNHASRLGAGSVAKTQVPLESQASSEAKVIFESLPAVASKLIAEGTSAVTESNCKLNGLAHQGSTAPEDELWAQASKVERAATTESKELLANVTLGRSLAIIKYGDLRVAERVGQGVCPSGMSLQR